jgi:hypothetical protein
MLYLTVPFTGTNIAQVPWMKILKRAIAQEFRITGWPREAPPITEFSAVKLGQGFLQELLGQCGGAPVGAEAWTAGA